MLKFHSMYNTYYNTDDREISAIATIDDLRITNKEHLYFEKHIIEKVNMANLSGWYDTKNVCISP